MRAGAAEGRAAGNRGTAADFPTGKFEKVGKFGTAVCVGAVPGTNCGGGCCVSGGASPPPASTESYKILPGSGYQNTITASSNQEDAYLGHACRRAGQLPVAWQ